MTEEQAFYILKQSLIMITLLSAPFFLLTLSLGLLISFFLSLFQLSESALLFIPKWIGTLILFGITFPWLFKIWSKYLNELLFLQWNFIFASPV